jgi:hypothetical protein
MGVDTVVHDYSSYRSDAWLLNDMIDLYQEGQLFYCQATKTADDYNLKRVFSQMAVIRRRMLVELIPLFRQEKYEPLLCHRLILEHKPIYVKALHEVTQQQKVQAIRVLLDTELRTLKCLKMAVKQANSQQVAYKLAEGTAWLQMTCDQLIELEAFYQ